MRKSVQHLAAAALFLSITTAAPAFGYEKEIETLSVTMADKIASKGKAKVAVVDFADLEGNIRYFDKFIAEQFSVALAGAGKGFRVIDRSHLSSLIKEHKLSNTGMIDQATARQLGKVAGVDALVTGTLTPFGDNVQLIVKVLDAETADVIDSAKINIARTQAVNELLGKEIDTASLDGGAAQKSEAKPAQGKEAKKDKGGNSGEFSDDFNAGPKPDWKPISGNWTMSNGQYTVTDIRDNESYLTFLEGKSWRNLNVDIDVTPGYSSGSDNRLNICPRMISPKERICFGMFSERNKFKAAYWLILKEGIGEPVSRVDMDTSEGQTVHIRIEVKNGVFTAYANGAQINQVYDATYPSGSIGFAQWYEYWTDEKIRMTFDNLDIKPLAD